MELDVHANAGIDFPWDSLGRGTIVDVGGGVDKSKAQLFNALNSEDFNNKDFDNKGCNKGISAKSISTIPRVRSSIIRISIVKI